MLPIISVLAENTLLKTAYNFLLLLVGVIAWLIRDDRLLISIRNSFFSGSPFGQNSKVKRAQLGVVLGWVTDREVAPGCA